MKLLVIGAGGKTGMAVVDQAVRRGLDVTALVHTYTSMPDGVHVVEGDATDAATVDAALAGQNAVIDTIGGATPYKETSLEATAARVLIAGMQRLGLRRLIAISALGVGDSKHNTSFVYDHLLMPTLLRGALPDKARMEAEITASPLDWTIVRPALLTDDEPIGSVRLYNPADGDTAHKIARDDLATFLLDQLTTDLHVGKAVTVATV